MCLSYILSHLPLYGTSLSPPDRHGEVLNDKNALRVTVSCHAVPQPHKNSIFSSSRSESVSGGVCLSVWSGRSLLVFSARVHEKRWLTNRRIYALISTNCEKINAKQPRLQHILPPTLISEMIVYGN